jgi:EAL domain-containing protein (putative c-di-GMP-specific phosphodiesterase class I)/GGDEF domain-containing protein
MPAVIESLASDKRLQKRFDVLQPASLRTASGRELACEIHNFCLGGLFLKFGGPQNDAAIGSDTNEGEAVEISFTPPASISNQVFNLKARLVRQSPDGVGVAFIGTPIEATRTLNKVAASMRTQRMVKKRYQGMDRKPLQETGKALLEQTIQDAVNEFYGLIEEKLSAAAARSTSFAERNDLMAAFGQVKLHEATALQGMQKRVVAALEHLLKPGKNSEPVREEAGLSLVETEAFDDWLNLMAEINKLENHFSAELAGLEPRLEKLYGRPIDRSTNPFAPSVIKHAVQGEFESLSLSLKARQVIYGTMGEALVHPLSELYQQLGVILPEADGPRHAAAVQAPGIWPDSQGTGLGEDMGPDSDMFVGGQPADDRQPGSPHPAQPATPPATAGGVAGALMNLFRRARGASLPACSTGLTAMPASGAGPAAHQAAPAPVGVAAPQNAASYGAPFAGRMGPGISDSSSRILGKLVADGRIQSGQEGAAQGSAEVFSVLAETIDTEKSLPGSVKHVVKQLQEPLLKLAVLDSGFLNSQHHPAHRVLNAVDRLAMVSSDDGRINDKKLLAIIQRWAVRIKNEADTNPGIYEEARTQLEKVLHPLMRFRNIRIARLQAGLEGWQKMGQANRTITQEIERRIDGREVPDIVLEFFNPGWRNYLIRVLLRHGAGSQEETDAWQAVDRLLEWMDPKLTERPPFNEVQRLLSYIDSRLTLVSAGKDVQEHILERLADGLVYPDRCNFKRLSGVRIAARHHEADPEPGEQDVALLGQFRVGDWLSFAGAATPLNLIWIGDDPHVYVFSNFKGVRKLELKRQAFLKLIKSGEAKRTDNLDLPMMDRSFSTMIEHIHHDLLLQATSDAETELMGRPEFMRRAKRAWQQVEGEEGGCVMGVIDIEDLRMVQMRINQEGYQTLMHALAQHLNQACNAGGFVARTGERTFAFMRDCPSQENAQEMAEGFITHINQFNFDWADEAFTLTANAGLAWASAYVEPETLYNKADTACLSAKHEGRNQLMFFHEEDTAHTGHAGLVYWASRFNNILSSDRLYLRCQPIVSLSDEADQTSHFEILLGAIVDENEPIHIGDFVAAIERLKRISELDQWVVRTVFGWIRSHPKEFEKVGAFSINLSGPSVNSKSFFSFMEEELGRGDIPGHKLIFEITESAAIDSFVNAEQFIKKFRRYGCRFSLDDFGVGFSSFTYLKNLKVDYLKIDGSFVRDMIRNEVDVALVSSMHETSRFLGIKTIAESVENEETLEQLKAIGVNYVQGYHTGMPMHIDQLAA